MKAFWAALAASAAAGCTTVGHVKVEGWPRLEVVEHRVPHKVMRERCGRYVPNALLEANACAEFDLASGRCNIWYSVDSPPSQAVIDHERLHCEGYDHVGSGSMRDLLERYNEWKASEPRR